MATQDEQGEQAKVYILSGAAVVGGIALGWAASQGWVEDKPMQPVGAVQEAGTWIAFNVGLVLLGSGVIEVVKEYGVAKVAGVSVGIPLAVFAIRALRG